MPRNRANPWPRALGVSLAVHLLLLLSPLATTVAAEAVEEAVIIELVEVPDPADGDLAIGEAPAASGDEFTRAELAEADAPDAQEVVKPEPRAEPEPEELPERELQHVRFDDSVEATDEVEDTHRIASKNVRVEQDTRRIQPVLDPGPQVPAQLGAPGSVGERSSQHTRPADSERGERDVADRTARRRAATGPTADEIADGEVGAATARGAKSLAEREGGREAQDEEGTGARPTSVASAGRPSAAVRGPVESSPLAPHGWQPLAVRIEPATGAPAPTVVASEVETERREDADAVQQARSERVVRETGDEGRVALRTPDAEDEEEDAPAVAHLDDDGEETEDLDRSWGGEQVEERQVEAGASGNTALTGQTATTPPLVVERTVDEDDLTIASARFDPLAPYMDEIEETVDARWKEITPLEVRAMGLQGTAVVAIEVDARGRVVNKTLLKQSGYSQLDEIALASIPKRVKRPPAGAADPTFEHALEFRHTDRWASVN